MCVISRLRNPFTLRVRSTHPTFYHNNPTCVFFNAPLRKKEKKSIWCNFLFVKPPVPFLEALSRCQDRASGDILPAPLTKGREDDSDKSGARLRIKRESFLWRDMRSCSCVILRCAFSIDNPINECNRVQQPGGQGSRIHSMEHCNIRNQRIRIKVPQYHRNLMEHNGCMHIHIEIIEFKKHSLNSRIFNPYLQ